MLPGATESTCFPERVTDLEDGGEQVIIRSKRKTRCAEMFALAWQATDEGYPSTIATQNGPKALSCFTVREDLIRAEAAEVPIHGGINHGH
jgi:hypothetical protein